MKTAKVKTEERAGVWMNHHIAHIVSRDSNGNFSITTIEPADTPSKMELKKKIALSEASRNAKAQQILKNFFKTLQKEVMPFDHILLSGPSTAKTEFHHLLKKSRSFTGKRIAEVNADTMTDRQLLAFMKKNLGKPMDIFRDEEVI